MQLADIAVRPGLSGGELHGHLGFGLDDLFNPEIVDLKTMRLIQLIDERDSTSSPCCTITLDGNQIFVPSRTTFIKVNFLGSAAAPYPAPSMNTVKSTTKQPSCRLHHEVSRTVISP